MSMFSFESICFNITITDSSFKVAVVFAPPLCKSKMKEFKSLLYTPPIKMTLGNTIGAVSSSSSYYYRYITIGLVVFTFI